MDRIKAYNLCKSELERFGLKTWGCSLSVNNKAMTAMGWCDYKTQMIILSAHHVDMHPDSEVLDTIRHEIAHALTPGHAHDSIWQEMCSRVECRPMECALYGINPAVMDAIRSGQLVEMEVEDKVIKRHVVVEETVQVPKYKVTRLQEKCPKCGKVAIERFTQEFTNKEGHLVKMITLDCFHVITKIVPRGTPFHEWIRNAWKPEIKSCKHIFPKDKDEAKQTEWPINRCKKCFEFKLFDFQVIGAIFAEHGLSVGKGVLIADDMGLGKTPQSLANIYYHPNLYTPTLYIVKSAIKFKWLKEILAWMGPDFLGQIINTSKDSVIPGLKTYIIAYDMMRRFPLDKLIKLGLRCVVLDECQQIKNVDSSRTQSIRKLLMLPDIKVIPLSGTPWKNRGSELFPVLNMIDPIKFHSNQHFLDTWVEYYYQGPKRKMGGIKNIPAFKKLTADLIIRREYNEVMDVFPDVNRLKISVQLDELSQEAYDDSTSDFVNWYNEHVISGTEDSISGIEILAQMSRMRHITGLAKIPATITYAEEFAEDTDKKLVIFVQHKDVGELIYNELTEKLGEDIPILRLTGTMSDVQKFEVAEKFNKLPRCFMVASTLAGGEGIDLQTCADCVMHERQWNPQNEDQAAPGRFRRIGQLSKQININVMEAEDTIDMHLDSIVSEKRARFHAVHNKGEVTTWNEGDIGKQLGEMIVKKHQEKMKKAGKPVVKKNITAQAKPRFNIENQPELSGW